MPPLDAFIWTDETKMMKLSTYLTNQGVGGIESWISVIANSTSPNGKILGGVGINSQGLAEGWIATLH